MRRVLLVVGLWAATAAARGPNITKESIECVGPPPPAAAAEGRGATLSCFSSRRCAAGADDRDTSWVGLAQKGKAAAAHLSLTNHTSASEVRSKRISAWASGVSSKARSLRPIARVRICFVAMSMTATWSPSPNITRLPSGIH